MQRENGMNHDDGNFTDPLKKMVALLGERSSFFVLSPRRMLFTLVVFIFVVETFIMIFLEGVEPAGWKETIIDSSLLSATLFIVLYGLLFKPLVLLIDDYKRNEIKLKSHQEHLEQLIQECALSEAALRETKAILQAAMDQSPAGIAIADAPDGTLRYVNDAGLLIRGADRGKVVDGVTIDQYVESWQLLDLDGKPLKNDEAPLARVILFGEPCSREIIIRRGHEDDRIVIVNAAPIRSDRGDVVAGVAVFLDITERIRVEEELKVYQNHLEQMVRDRSRDLENTSSRLKQENEQHVKAKCDLLESEERFRQIFEQSEDAIILISPLDNTIIDVNPTAERIFKKPRMEMLAHGLSVLCDSDGSCRLELALAQIIQNDSKGLIEKFECILPPGEAHILSFHG